MLCVLYTPALCVCLSANDTKCTQVMLAQLHVYLLHVLTVSLWMFRVCSSVVQCSRAWLQLDEAVIKQQPTVVTKTFGFGMFAM